MTLVPRQILKGGCSIINLGLAHFAVEFGFSSILAHLAHRLIQITLHAILRKMSALALVVAGRQLLLTAQASHLWVVGIRRVMISHLMRLVCRFVCSCCA